MSYFLNFRKRPKPIVLIILDGWGIAPPSKSNAMSQAKLPNFNRFINAYPHTELQASGEAVGLPKDEQGNSETGHLNLGAGSVVLQSLPKINYSIADGSFFVNKNLKAVATYLKNNSSNLHLMGLIGSGGVHSNMEHLFALLHWAKMEKITNVFLHLFTDGRDSPPYSCLEFLRSIEDKCSQYGVGKISTIMGRYYAMDRDNRWDRIKIAYEALTQGKGKIVNSYVPLIEELHRNHKSDEFIEPIIIKDKDGQTHLISSNDAVIFFNFRVDRPRELTKAFVLPNFENLIVERAVFDPYAEKYGLKQYQDVGLSTTTFKRNIVLKNLLFTTMTEYEPGLPVLTLFPPDLVINPLPVYLADLGWHQLHLAETEKERHVTYYFDGKRESNLPGEDRIIIPSAKVRTYDLKPEMSAYEITEELIKRIKLNLYDFIVVNFANTDMVGHTGVLAAGIKACEVIDECLGKIVTTINTFEGVCLITGDHGNVEEMINLETREIDTQHSANPVPFILISQRFIGKSIFLPQGILADVAPTLLKIAGLDKPANMTGKSLL